MFQVNSAAAVFSHISANAKEIQFDKNWKNGTGYLNGAVSADLGLVPGEVRSFVDDHGRRGVVIGTRVGNVALFERYTDDRGVIVFNAPEEVREHISELCLGYKNDESKYLMSYPSVNGKTTPMTGQNIGQWF